MVKIFNDCDSTVKYMLFHIWLFQTVSEHFGSKVSSISSIATVSRIKYFSNLPLATCGLYLASENFGQYSNYLTKINY